MSDRTTPITSSGGETPAGGFAKWLGILGTVLGLAGTAIGVWSQVEVAHQQKMSAELQRQVDLLTAEREDRKLDFEIALRVYEKVIDTDQSDPADLRLAVALIEVLPDTDFKARIGTALAALSTSVANTTDRADLTTVAKSVAETAQYLSQQALIPQTAPLPLPSDGTSSGSGKDRLPSGWIYSVFWCESDQTAANRRTAEDVAAKIGNATTGTVKTGLLPEEINARPDFGISGTLIRAQPVVFDSIQMPALLDILAEATGRNFEMRMSNDSLPWDIRIYICNG